METFKDKEGELFMRYLSGKDERSFRELYDCLNPLLFNVIYSFIGNKASAKDILQETWIAVVKYGDKFDPRKGKFKNYIYMIAKNQLFHWKKLNKEFYPINESNLIYPENHETSIENRELGEIIRASIKNLKNKKFQDALMLYYFGDLKINEISEILETTRNNVKNWLRRGRDKLETELRKNQGVLQFRDY